MKTPPGRRVAGAAEMEALGAALARSGVREAVIWLSGELGAGKTTLARGLIRAAGFSGPVRSPTYTLIETYDDGGRRIHHLDLYRVNDPEELELIGVRDYLGGGALCLVEWPERAAGLLPRPDLRVHIEHRGRARRVRLSPASEAGERLAAAAGGAPRRGKKDK